MRASSLLLAAVVIAASATTVGFVVRVPCPQCLGEGLMAEPPGDAWKTHWVFERDLTPAECPSCSDRLKVSLFRKWGRGPERTPEPPLYRAKHGEAFREKRRARIGELRNLAIRGMGRDCPPSGTSSRPDLLPILAAAFDDEDGKVRAHAILTVAEMNHEKALPVLLGALNHEDSDVQQTACLGLGWLGRAASVREAAIKELTGVYDSADKTELQVRVEAARALFDLGALRSADLFVEALKEKQVRWEIARKVFVHFQRKEFTFALIKKMATVDPSRTSEYGQDLERLTGEKFGDDPVKWYRWFEQNRASYPPQIE